MTSLQHNGKAGRANTSLCTLKQIQIMREAGFCLFIGNITVKLLCFTGKQRERLPMLRALIAHHHTYAHRRWFQPQSFQFCRSLPLKYYTDHFVKIFYPFEEPTQNRCAFIFSFFLNYPKLLILLEYFLIIYLFLNIELQKHDASIFWGLRLVFSNVCTENNASTNQDGCAECMSHLSPSTATCRPRANCKTLLLVKSFLVDAAPSSQTSGFNLYCVIWLCILCHVSTDSKHDA